MGQSNGDEDSYSYLLEVSLVKESEEELVPEQKLNYTYEQEWYNSTLQLLTLHFVAPDYVSQDSEEHDKIRIMFNDTSPFSSKQYGQMRVT